MIEAVGMLTLVGAAVVVGLTPTRPLANCDPKSAQAQLLRRAELRGTYVLAIAGATLGFGLLGFASGRPLSALLVAVIGVTALAVMHPWPLVSRILIPLGWWRSAAAWSRLGGPWLRDPVGGTVLAGMMACARCRKPKLEALLELEHRLADAPLRGAGIVAAALIAHERGDLVSARALMRSLDDLEPDIVPPLCRVVAFDWRVAEAAVRGDWGEIRYIGQDAMSLSRTARFFVLVARKMAGVHVHRRCLVHAWLRGPRRRFTWGLLRMALRARALPPTQVLAPVHVPQEAVAANGGGLLGTTAAGLHVEAARAKVAGELRPAALERLGDAWDRTLFDFDVRRPLRARALALGCSVTIEHHVVALQRNLCRDLAAFLPRHPLDPPQRPGLLARALGGNHRRQQALTTRRLASLTAAMEAKVGPPSWRLWTLWLSVRTAYEQAAHGASVAQMRAVFARLEVATAPIVGWLWVTRQERALANAIAFWLVGEAERVRLGDAAAHHRSWAAAGP